MPDPLLAKGYGRFQKRFFQDRRLFLSQGSRTAGRAFEFPDIGNDGRDDLEMLSRDFAVEGKGEKRTGQGRIGHNRDPVVLCDVSDAGRDIVHAFCDDPGRATATSLVNKCDGVMRRIGDDNGRCLDGSHHALPGALLRAGLSGGL